MLKEIQDLALEKKAEDLKILDIRDVSNIADYFVICSGGSDRQVITISEHIMDQTAARGIKPIGVEGVKDGRWVILDYADVIVHIFYQPLREMYEFDDLWSLGIEYNVS